MEIVQCLTSTSSRGTTALEGTACRKGSVVVAAITDPGYYRLRITDDRAPRRSRSEGVQNGYPVELLLQTPACYGRGHGVGRGRGVGGGRTAGKTLTTPVIPAKQCMAQKYWYMPAA